MNNRPDIELKQNASDKTLDSIGALMIAAIWFSTWYIFQNSPDSIPTHFGADGHPDKFGPKGAVWIYPVLGTFIHLLLTIIGRYPQSLNYLRPITPENAERQYRIATTLIKFMKVAILMILLIIQWSSYLVATKKSGGLGWWFLPTVLGLALIPTIIAAIKSLRPTN